MTKGVRGERKMKDSGVEWIGEIPVHWKISRIKYVSIFEPSCDFRKLTPETIITYSPMECIKMALLNGGLLYMEILLIH